MSEIVKALAHMMSLRLSADEERQIESAYATQPDGKWWLRRVVATSETVLELRALAGLLLFDERVLWLAPSGPRLHEDFYRLRKLIYHSECAHEIEHVSATNGGQKIATRAGAILFVSAQSHAARGLSVDTLISHGVYIGPTHEVVPCLATAPNPQYVEYAGWVPA